jgi:DNA-binding NarL/FixJ family response regulator
MVVDLVRRQRPHVALLDLAMPPPGGHAAIRAVKRAHPAVRVLALSGLTDEQPRLEALRAGADGFLPKTSEPEDLLHPLLAMVQGYSVLPTELLRGLVRSADRPSGGVVDELDEDQRRLWLAVARGDSTEEIAAQWIVSQRTAKRMIAALLRRIGAGNRIEAAALAGRSGLLDDR